MSTCVLTSIAIQTCVCVCACVRERERGQTPATLTLSAISFCSLHGSTPAVPALERTEGWVGTDINSASNPCGYVPYTPLLMTMCSPFHQCVMAWCLDTNSGGKNLRVHINIQEQDVLVCVCVQVYVCEWRGNIHLIPLRNYHNNNNRKNFKCKTTVWLSWADVVCNRLISCPLGLFIRRFVLHMMSSN